MDYNKLGDNIRKFRKKNYLTQEQLAEKAGLSSIYVSQIERAERKPSLDSLDAISKSLQVPLLILLKGQIDPIFDFTPSGIAEPCGYYDNKNDKCAILDEITLMLKDRSLEELSLISDNIKVILKHTRNNNII